MNKFLRIVTAFIEIYVLGYAILMAYLISVWMESDSFAYSATEIDWWIEAGKRFVISSGLAFALAGLVWLVNKPLLKRLGFKNESLPAITASVFGGSLCIASLIGAIVFAITKPFM